MSICLVHTPVPELQDDRLDPPMGLLYLGTVLKQAGIDVQILDLSGIPESEWIFPEAEWYGFSTYTANYYRTAHIKNMVKAQHPSVKTIAGGPHASAKPLEAAFIFDHVIVGEGEAALLGLVKGEITGEIIAGCNMDIDEIPFPDYSLVDINSYTREYLGKQSFQIFTSRGCPYKCGFCSKLPDGHIIRRRHVSFVVHEIMRIQSEYDDISFRFKDDLFTSNPKWLRSFDSYNLGIEYSCNVRADFKDEIPDLLVSSGCKTACIGIESGSDKVLKAMKKGTTREQNLSAIKRLKDVGIQVLTWIVVGYPGETYETLYETISLLEEAQPDLVRAYPLIPYPGTQVYNEVEILDKNYDHYFYIYGNNEHGFVHQTAELPRGEIMGMWATLDRYLKKFNQRVEGS